MLSIAILFVLDLVDGLDYFVASDQIDKELDEKEPIHDQNRDVFVSLAPMDEYVDAEQHQID